MVCIPVLFPNWTEKGPGCNSTHAVTYMKARNAARSGEIEYAIHCACYHKVDQHIDHYVIGIQILKD